MLTSKAARANPRETRRKVLCATSSIVLTSTILQPARFTVRSIEQLVTNLSTIIATKLPTPEGWMAWLTVPASGVEPGPARLVMQEVRWQLSG